MAEIVWRQQQGLVLTDDGDPREVLAGPGHVIYFNDWVSSTWAVELLKVASKMIRIRCGKCNRILEELHLFIPERKTYQQELTRNPTATLFVYLEGRRLPPRDGSDDGALKFAPRGPWTEDPAFSIACRCGNDHRINPKNLLKEFLCCARAGSDLFLTHKVRARPRTPAASRSRSGRAWA